MTNRVAALCVEPAGVYPELVADWYDQERDARSFAGGKPVIAHPPCGPWGRLWKQCINQDMSLGPWCVQQVQRWGGVLEHPAHSRLFAACNLPEPGQFPDAFGGQTYLTWLSAFGAPVAKPTWLYVVGVDDFPDFPRKRPAITTVDRLHSSTRQLTPRPMAEFLIELASQANITIAHNPMN
ncbi:MAG: hypothetical protein ACF8OB_12925 [Phycisphaeraceae bacterium JB051]